MAGKGFCVKIRLELHAITCPGVWLCPNGKVALRITSLGSTLESHRVSPIFPLLFHDEFNFKKTFTRLATLTELQRKLEQEILYAELIQWIGPCNHRPVLLANFETNLADLLYPVANCKGLLAGVDVDLLMDPSKYFPGIIAPKIEISTRTVIEEVLGTCCGGGGGGGVEHHRGYALTAKTIDSKRGCAHRKRPVKGIIRQRRVCHGRAKTGAIPICRSTRRESRNVENSYQGERPRSDERRRPSRDTSNRRREFATGKNENRLSAVCDNLRIFDGCPVCSKYKCRFSSEPIVDERKRNRSKDVEDRSPCTPTKDDRFVSISAASSKDRQIPEIDGKPRSLVRDGTVNSISECCDCCPHTPDDTNHGFYTNLERFYKRMYKQAIRRAQEANAC